MIFGIAFIALAIQVASQAAAPLPAAPRIPCWDICRTTCLTINNGTLSTDCVQNCPCKCSEQCMKVCYAYALGETCLNQCGCPSEMLSYMPPNYKVTPPTPPPTPAPVVPQGPVIPQEPVNPIPVEPILPIINEKPIVPPVNPPTPVATPPPMAPLSMEDQWMMNQYNAMTGNAQGGAIPDMGAMMQQKLQFEAMMCTQKCQNQCTLAAMGNVLFFQQCLAVCTC